MNILSKKVTVSYLFKLLLVSAGLAMAPYQVYGLTNTANVDGASDFTGTIAGADLSAKMKTYLYCNDASGAQKCSLAMYIPAAVDGNISPTRRSSVEITITGISSTTTNATHEAVGVSTLGDATQLTAWTGLTGTYDSLTNTLPGDTVMANTNANSLSATDVVTTPTDSTTTKALVFDPKVCFSGDSNADYLYTIGSTLASQHADPKTVTENRVGANHPAFLLSKASAEFDRINIGAAKNFTIAYTVTVTANSLTGHATGCSADG